MIGRRQFLFITHQLFNVIKVSYKQKAEFSFNNKLLFFY